jgi:hypothetical protein
MSQRDLSEVSTAQWETFQKQSGRWNLPPGHTVLSLLLHHCCNAGFLGRGFPLAPKRGRCFIYKYILVASNDRNLPNLSTVSRCSESSRGPLETHVPCSQSADFTLLWSAFGARVYSGLAILMLQCMNTLSILNETVFGLYRGRPRPRVDPPPLYHLKEPT